jgi:cyanophycinase
MDISQIHVDAHSTYFSAQNVVVHYLTNGDIINLQSMAITFSPTKSAMSGHEKYAHALTSDDVFYGSSRTSGRKPEFVRIATSIFDSRLESSTSGHTSEKHPTFTVTMARTGHDAEGWVERKSSFHTDITSYKNMYLEIHGTH